MILVPDWRTSWRCEMSAGKGGRVAISDDGTNWTEVAQMAEGRYYAAVV